MEVAALAQRADLGGAHPPVLHDLVEERDRALLDRFVLQEEAVVVREGRALRVALRGLHQRVAELALEVSDDLQVELASAVSVHGERAEGARAVPLDELALEDLDGPHEGLVVVGDVAHLLVEEVDGLVGGPEELVGGGPRCCCGVQLFLQPHDLLLEHQDQLLLLRD